MKGLQRYARQALGVRGSWVSASGASTNATVRTDRDAARFAASGIAREPRERKPKATGQKKPTVTVTAKTEGVAFIGWGGRGVDWLRNR